MILWSILPADIVLNNIDSLPAYEEISYSGMKCLVEKTGATQYKVIRLLTTNPKDYLRPELQPGTMLKYEPIWKAHY